MMFGRLPDKPSAAIDDAEPTTAYSKTPTSRQYLEETI
jgi:hypothetical protein